MKNKKSPENNKMGQLQTILDAMSDEHAVLLGFQPGNHPRNMTSKDMFIPRVAARPKFI